MSIRFILGRSGVGKTRLVLNEIKAACDELPQGDPIFVIAPDQMTFHLEYQLLKQSQYPSLMRVQGLSFNRFAYRILQETGGLSRYHLNQVGLALLLQKVMNEKKGQLSLFPFYANKPGFISKVSEMIAEFKNYCVTPNQLFQTIQTQQEISNWSVQSVKKINDIAILYDEFEKLSLGRYLMTEDYYTLLSEQIAYSSTIANSDFYIDGYHLFNKQEELILLQLMKYAKSVTIVLTHDLNSTSSVFSLPSRTYSKLASQLEEMGLNYEIQELTEGNHRFKSDTALAHLEKQFMQFPTVKSEAKGVHFFQAANSRLEVEEVAKRIHHLIHKEGYAFNDIAIYTAQSEEYQELIASIFPKFEIPVFLDYKESMLIHPLMVLLYHVFDVMMNGWRHESMFMIIKTGLFMDVSQIKKQQSFYEAFQAYQRQVDVLENYCLARQIKKQDWQQKDDWVYEKYQGLGRGYVKTDDDLAVEDLLNTLKKQISSLLTSFEKKLKKAKTYKEFAVATFTFLEEAQIPQKLALLESSAEETQHLKLLKQHQQVWNKVLELFEQLVEIGQEEAVSLENFATVFKAGLEEMSYATVPPRLDQVSVGELRRARYQLVTDLGEAGQYGIKHAFVLGVNEGQIPSVMGESSLLSEVEREQLKELGIELAPSLEQSQQDEQFILYTVFTSPKQTLTLSYVSSNDEGKEFLPSYVYNQLKEMFPLSQEAHIGREFDDDLYEQLTTLNQSVAHLLAHLKQNPAYRSYYEPLLAYYKEHNPLIYQMVMRILGYENEVTNLDEVLTKKLYSEEIVASVSRLELFNQCEFAHYLRYGLQLKDRERYQLDLPHIGELYHEALKRIATMIQKENRTFADLTQDECQTLAKMVSDELSEQLLYKILKQNKRMMKLTERLTHVVYKTLIGLKYQSSQSEFKPMFFELPFQTGKSNGIHIDSRPIGKGFKLSLKGIIDRVDVAKSKDESQAYLRIVDYKSSQQDLELDKVYYGLSLQLLTYLDVVVTNALQLIDMPAEVGGLLYFHVHRPIISKDDQDLLRDVALEEQILRLHQEDFKMKGYLPDDYDVVTLSDHRITDRLKSDVVPITLKKDGSFSSRGTSTLSPAELSMLRNYTNQTIERAATKITQGSLQINPSHHGDRKACDFCSYRGVCQFDIDFLGNQPRILAKMKKENALEAIKCQLEEGGDQDESSTH